MNEASYGKLQSESGSPTSEERREITAVSIPGRFLPEPATTPTGRLAPERDEPSLEVAAAVHRLVASTDDAARGLTGFRWDPDEEPAGTPLRSVAATQPAAPQIHPAVALSEEYTPLPVPMLPPADVLPARTTADLPSWEPAPGPLDIAAPAPLDFPPAPLDAPLTFRVALPVPSEVVAPSGSASVPSEAVFLPSEVDVLPSEVNVPSSEVVAATSEVIPHPAAPTAAAVFSLKATPNPDQVVPGITDPDWAPVGFSPEMVVAAAPSGSAGASPVRSNISPIAAAVPAQQVPAAVASPNNGAAAASNQRTGNALVVWTWMLRVGQTLRGSTQALVSAGRMRLRTWPSRLRIFGERVRSAAARLGLRLERPVDLRSSLPWLAVAMILLIVVLFTAHSCATRSSASHALPRDSITATQQEVAAKGSQEKEDTSPRIPGTHRNGA